MRKTLAGTALMLSLLTACAPNVFRVDAGAMFVEADGEIALQNPGGSLTLGNEQNRLADDLGLGDREASPYVRMTWERDLHRVRVHGFGFETEGSGTLAGDFGGIVAGSAVTTSMDFLSAGAAYSYQVFDNDWIQIGIGGQLTYNLLNVDTRAVIGSQADEVQTDVVVPMPFAEIEARLGDVTLGANAGVMSADLGDANGRYWDVEAMARWQINDTIQVLGGYRYILMDAFGTASSRDFDADVDLHGWFIGGGVRF
ncbi:MAG: hypothetical protein NXI31_05070 [bacterium]|nr:hypothetical protein [bacterium]